MPTSIGAGVYEKVADGDRGSLKALGSSRRAAVAYLKVGRE